MDNKMVAKEMMKDFIRKTAPADRLFKCPFYNEHDNIYYHDLCAVVFPGWGKKYLKDKKAYGNCCPCKGMSHNYIRRKSREFVKKNK